jgi:hypothetical protein
MFIPGDNTVGYMFNTKDEKRDTVNANPDGGKKVQSHATGSHI